MILAGDASQSIAQAGALLSQGGLVGMPTETVYGLAADACSDAAVARIFAAKGRPADHPLIVHIAHTRSVEHFARDIPAFAQRLMDAFWPGPLTLILPRRAGVASASAAGQDSIGLRCPSHPVARALLQDCERRGLHGLSAPSANRFGRVSPTSAAHVQEELGEALLVLDGGPCSVGIESSIVDCTRGAPVLLRPGMIALTQLEGACGLPILDAQAPTPAATDQPRASGTLESHYAPNAQVRLMNAAALTDALKVFNGAAGSASASAGGPRVAIYHRCKLKVRTDLVLPRTMPDNAPKAAQELFAVLRELDHAGVKLIWVEEPPPQPEWDGVRDRLTRACAPR